jgi:hypothetical protein
MRRLIEWGLAAIGATLCIGGAMAFGQGQSTLWPMPALALIDMALLGLIGLLAIAVDDGAHTLRWGIVTWAVIGGLIALMLVGAWTIGPLLLIAVLAFATAAILADTRRNRKILSDVGVLIIGAASNAVMLFLFIIATRA